MTVAEAEAFYKDQVLTLGRAALHNAYPNDFELYFCALELVSSDNSTIDYFAFPVMPKQIRYTEPQISSIKKSRKGISVYKTTSFVPKSISISGDFGRKFKFLLGDVFIDSAAILLSTGSGNFGQFKSQSGVFNPQIKTGYGCIKILKGILDKSTQLDGKGKLPKLFFYNPAIGESYEVVVNSPDYSMNENDSNMIWQYSVTLTAIAPIEQSELSSEEFSYPELNKEIQQTTNNYASGGFFLE